MTTESGFYHCPYCYSPKGFVYVHGHYQCQTCGNNVNPCCGGETMDECSTFSVIKMHETPVTDSSEEIL